VKVNGGVGFDQVALKRFSMWARICEPSPSMNRPLL